MTVARSTCDTFDTDLAVATNAVIDTITAATADSDGDNLFAAMDMAGRTIAAGGWSNATILVIDSGLAERPNSPINFAQPGMTSLNDDQITAAADFATTNQPLDLKGVTVAFHGLAATAAPQPSLSPAEAQVIAKLWVEIAKNAGADSVTAVPTPRTGPGPQTRYITTVIPPADVSTFEPPTPGNPTRAKFGEEDIHFAFDSATITDPGAATAKLAQLTAWLADDPTHRVQLRGRTDSSGTPGHNEDLAGRRATSVKALILTADPRISPSQISTFADGESFKGALPDTRPDGSLDPIPAAMNRHVLAMATTD
ncbi:hypothetical protein N798_00205 [Knoellia flava TL1]|nr:hypothetical protein N798_00205 [Knoellia flava TL1]